MNIFSELKIGDKLSIEFCKKDTNQAESNMLNAQLIDINDNCLYISSPIYRGKRYSLYEGQKITMFFYRKKGVYQFDAKIVKKIESNIVTFALKLLGDVEKIQRRNYYRLPIVTDAILKKHKNDKILEFECVTKDLSGGGVKVVCKNEVEKSDNITIDIYLDEDQVITMDGEVIRITKDLDNNLYEIGIKFKETNETGTDRIFSFIFEKQRLMRKKGLI